jgi:REP element-mobilizing transposase RayT
MSHRLAMVKGPGHQALRQGRASLPHHCYLVTTVTAARRRWFGTSASARAVARLMIEQGTWGDARVHACVLMPDHWHGLLQLGDRDGLPIVMNRLKALSAKAVSHKGDKAQVWARGFHDHALRRDESIREVARYIIANPLRAGIVSHPLDYPYWDTAWLLDDLL